MPLLHIALQEGFTGEPVAVSLDGHQIFQSTQVRTRTQIGFAQSVEVTEAAGDVTVEITARGNTTRIPLRLDRDLYVGLSITPEGRITHRTAAEPFGYV